MKEVLKLTMEDNQLLLLELNSFKIFCKTIIQSHKDQSKEILDQHGKLKTTDYLNNLVTHYKERCQSLEIKLRKAKTKLKKTHGAIQDYLEEQMFEEDDNMDLINQLQAENDNLRQMLGIHLEVHDQQTIQKLLQEEEEKTLRQPPVV